MADSENEIEEFLKSLGMDVEMPPMPRETGPNNVKNAVFAGPIEKTDDSLKNKIEYLKEIEIEAAKLEKELMKNGESKKEKGKKNAEGKNEKKQTASKNDPKILASKNKVKENESGGNKKKIAAPIMLTRQYNKDKKYEFGTKIDVEKILKQKTENDMSKALKKSRTRSQRLNCLKN